MIIINDPHITQNFAPLNTMKLNDDLYHEAFKQIYKQQIHSNNKHNQTQIRKL